MQENDTCSKHMQINVVETVAIIVWLVALVFCTLCIFCSFLFLFPNVFHFKYRKWRRHRAKMNVSNDMSIYILKRANVLKIMLKMIDTRLTFTLLILICYFYSAGELLLVVIYTHKINILYAPIKVTMIKIFFCIILVRLYNNTIL